MTLGTLIEHLNHDIAREYAHWHFYMNASIRVTGLHREEFSEFFLKEAQGEMTHIVEFGKLIVGLGGTPVASPDVFATAMDSPKDLLAETLRMEEQVVQHFVDRQDEAEALEKNGGTNDLVNGRRVNVFLDDQILDSRATVDHVREMLKGM